MSAKKRKFLTLEQKLGVIKEHRSGKKVVDIARALGVNESSVRTILKRKVEYEEEGMQTSALFAKVTVKKRNTVMSCMEQMLLTWILDCSKTGIPLTQTLIQEKAVSLYNSLKDAGEDGTSEEFTASRGWFYRFKERAKLHAIKLSAESARAGESASAEFSEEFKKLISMVECGYPDEQAVDADETDMHKEKSRPGCQPSKDRGTLLVVENADLTVENVKECFSSDVRQLIDEEIREIKEASAFEPEVQIQELAPVKDLSLCEIESILKSVDGICEQISVSDPNLERSLRIQCDLQKAVESYKDLINEKRKTKSVQKTLDQGSK